jgi:hypothetical protein
MMNYRYLIVQKWIAPSSVVDPRIRIQFFTSKRIRILERLQKVEFLNEILLYVGIRNKTHLRRYKSLFERWIFRFIC